MSDVASSPQKTEPRQRLAGLSLVVGGCVLGALLLGGLGWLVPPRSEVPAFLVVTFGAFVALVIAYRPATLDRLSRRELLWLLVLGAALLRFSAGIAPTSLSDDVFRYIWDGRSLLQGINPYVATPRDLVVSGALSGPLFELINSPDHYSVYPPLAQFYFAGGTAVADLIGLSADGVLRLGFGLVDVLTVVLLVAVLEALEKPRRWALLYAFNPFVAWEIVGGGHSEAIMLPLALGALLLALREKPVGLGVALGLAALAKLTVLIIAPALGWYIVRRRSFVLGGLAAAVAVAVLVAGYAPLWFDGMIENQRSSLALYYGHFIFNAPIFDLCRSALGYVEGVTPSVTPLIIPWFTASVVVVTAVSALAVNGVRGRLAPALYAATLAHAILSPVVHPWYLLLPLLLSLPARAYSALVLTALVPLSYIAYTTDLGRVPDDVMFAQYAPFAFVLCMDVLRSVLGPILRRRARRKFRSAAGAIPSASSVLDIGAGEGYVGREAARAGHRAELVDVANHNCTDLPHKTYDGMTLPFESDSFDVGLLCYVLHHCREPDRVITEAARVCRRLIVMESTYESGFDRRLLTFLDHQANVLRGIPIEPLYFDTVAGWTRRFEAAGLRVVETRWLGRVVHKHVLFVLDRVEA